MEKCICKPGCREFLWTRPKISSQLETPKHVLRLRRDGLAVKSIFLLLIQKNPVRFSLYPHGGAQPSDRPVPWNPPPSSGLSEYYMSKHLSKTFRPCSSYNKSRNPRCSSGRTPPSRQDQCFPQRTGNLVEKSDFLQERDL